MIKINTKSQNSSTLKQEDIEKSGIKYRKPIIQNTKTPNQSDKSNLEAPAYYTTIKPERKSESKENIKFESPSLENQSQAVKFVQNQLKKMDIPVQVSTKSVLHDPTQAKYEQPIFIHKSENVMKMEEKKPSVEISTAANYKKEDAYTVTTGGALAGQKTISPKIEKTSSSDEPMFVQVRTVKSNTQENSSTEILKKKKNHSAKENNTYDDDLSSQMQQDMKVFISQFDNKKGKADKIKSLVSGQNRIGLEIKELENTIHGNLDELMELKKTALKLNDLVNRYTNKMVADRQAKFGIADEVLLKNLLRDKIHREMQGFRTSTEEYKELEQVNPADIRGIVNEIEKLVNTQQ